MRSPAAERENLEEGSVSDHMPKQNTTKLEQLIYYLLNSAKSHCVGPHVRTWTYRAIGVRRKSYLSHHGPAPVPGWTCETWPGCVAFCRAPPDISSATDGGPESDVGEGFSFGRGLKMGTSCQLTHG